MVLTNQQVSDVAACKYGDLAEAGWGPRLRHSFGYFTPDDWYEAMVSSLVGPGTSWLDVGCGREVLPSNPRAARRLADRCLSLTGLDPSDNIDENPFLHHRAKCTLEAFDAPEPFDVITLRMVVEHLTNPEAAVQALSRLCKPGGQVVIYTVDKWSPISLVSALTPMSFHHRMKHLLWRAEEKDTFPATYLMNTRRRLATLMSAEGFIEADFLNLADTRTTSRFRLLNTVELAIWRGLRSIGVVYPEKCLMGVYRKTS